MGGGCGECWELKSEAGNPAIPGQRPYPTALEMVAHGGKVNIGRGGRAVKCGLETPLARQNGTKKPPGGAFFSAKGAL